MKRDKSDILLTGVGGQGIVSIAAVIACAALKKGWHIKQSEVHGMSQRGGAVQSHLRISKDVIYSDLLGVGSTDLLLSVEPLEALRYLPYLSPKGVIVSSRTPFANIDNYPAIEEIEQQLTAGDRCTLIDATALAREAGNPRTSNMVVLGAASLHTGIDDTLLENAISDIFENRGAGIVDANIRAFHLGRDVVATEKRQNTK